jgi:hypothetical protein
VVITGTEMENMKIRKLVDEIPYLLYVTGLTFIVISCTSLLVGSALRHTKVWWLLIAIPLIAVVYSLTFGLIELRKRGLNYSATMGELTQAMKRD